MSGTSVVGAQSEQVGLVSRVGAAYHGVFCFNRGHSTANEAT